MTESQNRPQSDDDIVPLDPMQHVRLRPGMYIGGIDARALHHMIYEVMDNAVEEALNDGCTHIWLTLRDGYQVSIRDNSQGLPLDVNEYGISMLQTIMTHIGPIQHKTGRSYRTAAGLHGVGLSVVNVLSADYTAEVARDGFLWRQSYKAGIPQTPVEQIRALSEGDSTGTTITFIPDFTIMEHSEFDYDRLVKRCREVAALTPGLSITLRDERDGAVLEDEFHFPNGLADWLRAMNTGKHALHEVVAVHERVEITPEGKTPFAFEIDVAFQYLHEEKTRSFAYINTVRTPDGGTHRRGFYAGLWRAVKSVYRQSLTWAELEPGLTMIVSILHPAPAFESPTKVKLLNSEVEPHTARVVKEALLKHPDVLAAIARKLEDRRAEPDIVALNPMEHVRLRPKMYFGSIDADALHHMVYEVMDRAICDAHNGPGHIWLTLHDGNRVTVRDDGPGLRVGMNPATMRDNLQIEMAFIGNGNNTPYQVGGGLHGIGLSAVNALSADCTAEVARDGYLWRQRYQEGEPQDSVKQVRALAEGDPTGTTITFTPDFSILDDEEFDYAVLANRCREIAYTLPELTITLRDERNKARREDIFHYPNGLVDWLHALNADEPVLHDVVHIQREIELEPTWNKTIFKLRVDIALQLIDRRRVVQLSYVNSNHSRDGGTHVRGFDSGLKQALEQFYPGFDRWKDYLPGLTTVMSIWHPYPSFESMTDIALINREVEGIVQTVVKEALIRRPDVLAIIARKLGG